MTRRASWLFLAVVASLLLGSLGLRPVYKADESRYAEIPREMVASGDWLTPRLNAFKYFEKPPLQYWATAAFFSVFGENDWASRLWAALACLAGLLMTWRAADRLFSSPVGAYGALVLAGSPLYVMLGQFNTLDMGLAFFLSAAIFAFALGRYYLFWAACALAVLSKGLVGIVLPLAAVGLYTLVKRDWSLPARMRPFTGPLVFLAIAAPWFVAVSLANAEFAHFFFVQEHFQRFTTRLHGRYEPVWFFVPVFAFGIAPWLLPSAYALARVARSAAPRQFDPQLLLALWALVVFVFFSISSSKLPSYILPMFPAVAVLTARWIVLGDPRRLLLAQSGLAALAGLALAAGGPALVSKLSRDSAALAAGYVPVIAAAGMLLAVASIAAAASLWRGKTYPALVLTAFGALGCTLMVFAGHRALAPLYSVGPQAARLQAEAPIPQAARFFAVDIYDHTLPWYFGRAVTMVIYRDELAEAIKWEPEKFIPDLQGFARAWQAAPSAYAVFASERFEALRREIEMPMEVVSRGPRYTIVRKP